MKHVFFRLYGSIKAIGNFGHQFFRFSLIIENYFTHDTTLKKDWHFGAHTYYIGHRCVARKVNDLLKKKVLSPKLSCG